jgi:hypothetical protein
VFQTYVINVSVIFGFMLHVFHLDVAKVDLVLHLLQRDPFAAAACYSCWGAVHAHGKRRGMKAGPAGPRACWRGKERVLGRPNKGSYVRANACKMEQYEPAFKCGRLFGRPGPSHSHYTIVLM